MRNDRIIYLLVIFSFLLHTGCKQAKDKNDAKKILSVTIEPQRYFLEHIVGERYTVKSIVPSGANPESFDFTPSQMMTLDKSVAYFKLGYLGIENTLIDKINKSNPNIKVINCSEGITAIGYNDGHTNCADSSHSSGGHASGIDPHIWSSPKMAKVIAANMYKAVVLLDKANEQEYTANYNKLIAEIGKTDSIIRTYLDKTPSKAFIIYHPALSYFAEEYGLKQYTIEYEGKNPSPSQLKELIDKAKAEGIKVVFIQQEYDTKNAETIAKSIGAKTIPINLLLYNWNEEMIKIARTLSE